MKQMTPQELKDIGEKLYGYGWQTQLSKELGVCTQTVRKWISGKHKIPNSAAAAIKCFADLKILKSSKDYESVAKKILAKQAEEYKRERS